MSSVRSIRVLVVDGEPLTREGIVACIRRWPGYRVCGAAGNAREARELCAKLLPELIVLDLPLGAGDGFGLIRELSRLHRAARTVAIAAHEDRDTVERALRAGAHGYVRHSDEPDELRNACAAVLRGERHVSHAVTQRLLGGMARPAPTPNGTDWETRLSERERAVFHLLGRGLGATAIARELGVAVKTVETHQQRIKVKLGVRSAQELRERALRANLRS